MKIWVVDTNVPVVANGRDDGDRPVASTCRIATIKFLDDLLEHGKVLVDEAGEVLAEYRRYLKPSGQPGVGDRFYEQLLRNVSQIERVELPVDSDNEFGDLHPEIRTSSFDRDDRKFVALATNRDAPIANAIDSDWIEHRDLLERHGLKIEFLCGCDPDQWFDS